MVITIIGTGYVGLVTGTCLSDFGHEVICVDKDAEKVKKLGNGEIPIYEPGLEDIAKKNIKEKRLNFSNDLYNSVKKSEVIFIAVGTPSREDGQADLSCVVEVARELGHAINGYKLIVNKSTVPVGTGRAVKDIIQTILKERDVAFDFDIASNPEFLREGSAIFDFTHPDRLVIGCESKKSEELMRKVYKVLYLNDAPFIVTGIESAELIKYASNAFLAMKITFINEVANLCEKVGANIQDVAKAVGSDGRIGSKFLHAGPGYGGSCFPKDTRALSYIGKKHGAPISIIDQTIQANEKQIKSASQKIICAFGGSLSGKIICVLGLAFKPNTDDMREAPSIEIIKGLILAGGNIKTFDPIAMDEAKKMFGNDLKNIKFSTNEYEAMQDADAVAIVTEWNQFRNIDFDKMKRLVKNPVLFDFRNIYRRKDIEQIGISYYGTGQ